MRRQQTSQTHYLALDPVEHSSRMTEAEPPDAHVELVITEELHAFSRELGLAEDECIRVSMVGSALKVTATGNRVDQGADRA
jgi:hypothetical protein